MPAVELPAPPPRNVEDRWKRLFMPNEQKVTPTLLMLKGETPGRIFELRGRVRSSAGTRTATST